MARDGTSGWRHPFSSPDDAQMAQPSAQVRDDRRRLRRARSELVGASRAVAERAIVRALGQLAVLRRGSRVAMYLPMGGEVDLRPAIDAAWRRGVAVFVPCILSRRRARMAFVRWNPDEPRRRNAYGIEEPAYCTAGVPVLRLDAVVLPVVGFDRRGNRLGMGAGYYDRALHRRVDTDRHWRRPRLIGVAFSCQELSAIAVSPWDVPLDLIVTERGPLVPERDPRRSNAT